MSWHETASLHINDKDASDFFSKMIINISNLFVIASCIIVGLLPVLFKFAIGKEYLEAYNYIPILIVANLCNVLVGLLGAIYIAKKMTKKVATTTIISAIINIIVNLIFIKKIGLYAACISTLVSYSLMIIYRYYDINKIIKLKLTNRKSLIYLCCLIILIITYYYKYIVVSLIISVICVLLYLIQNRKNIIELAQGFFSKKKQHYEENG